jgi:hypothetical protein
MVCIAMDEQCLEFKVNKSMQVLAQFAAEQIWILQQHSCLVLPL